MKKNFLASAIRTIAYGALASGVMIANTHATQYDHWKNFKHHNNAQYFERIATFPVFENLDLASGDSLDDSTAAEISAASRDGKVIFYSDSPKGRVGLIDIKDPAKPKPAGFVQLDGEPTSVAVKDNYLLVGINTSSSFTQPSGKLSVYWIGNPLQPRWLSDFDLGGQPDAIAISPNGRYAAIAIENERDEDLNDGFIPQQPAGHLSVITMSGPTSKWKVRNVDLRGYSDIAPSDPEPEYVAINKFNIAAVTLQENNHVILVDLRRAKVIHDFTAGSADLFDVDTIEDDVIEPIDLILDRRREPDAVAWLNNWQLVTANEGDYEDEQSVAGGSRGFTIFNASGRVSYESGSSLEHELIRAGHYPESRSENKGIEPEAVTVDRYGRNDFIFIGNERANIIAVYSTRFGQEPKLHQLLPTTVGPEGVLTIPSRNLLVVASEEDSADDGIRSTVSIYRYGESRPDYPQIKSTENTLLPWGALSGMVGDNNDEDTIYAVPDSYYAKSRIFKIDVSQQPAIINTAIILQKDGATVDYDLEGIAQRTDGSFWLVSEGNGGSRPNLLIRAAKDGTVLEEINLPADTSAKQKSNGFEGVAVVGDATNEKVVIAFQREWNGDAAGLVRIGFYSPASDEWTFAYYPIDDAQPGAWVGLSELTAIDDNNFAVIERDNQQGTKARLKRLYRFSTEGLTTVAEGQDFPVLEKLLVRDLLPDLKASYGWVLDKVEGTAITKDGEVFIVTDNDGVDDSSGETRFMGLGKLFE
ncbi:esterase-like activity of phytase family protein [Aurantivibrio infirmus]